jgi:hypothetical protein
VSVGVVVNLGKTPTEQATLNLQTTLTAAGSPQLVALQAAVVQAASAATSVPASYFAVSAPAAVSFAYSPFIAAAAPASSASSSGGAGGASSGLGTGLGIAAGVAVLACCVWSVRSYRKHGQLPCCRDRAREKRNMLSERASQIEVANALAEVEAVVGADDNVASRFGGGDGSGGAANKKALAVKRLVAKAKAAEDEVAELRRQLRLREEASAPTSTMPA